MIEGSTRSLLIEFFADDGTLSTFVAAAHLDTPTVETIPWTDEQTLALLGQMSTMGAAAATPASDEWRALSEVTVGHLQRHLRRGDRIVFVPHRLLHYAPLHLLPLDGDCLIASHAVSYASSASMLSLCRMRNPRRSDAGFRPTSAAVIALDFEEEVEVVTRHFESVEALRRSRDAITMDSIQATSRNKHVVHFSAHGTISADPDYSGLVLTDRNRVGEKRLLTLRDVYGLDLRCTLVTLGACQTGLGAYQSGDEILGLSRGFHYAGAPSVLTSLWTVPNEATLLLMEQFYVHWLERNLDKADALRAAELAVRERYPANWAWAGFTLSGDWV